MWSISFGVSVSPTSINTSRISAPHSDCNILSFIKNKKPATISVTPRFPSSNRELLNIFPCRSGICGASQVVDLFPTVSPQVVVREARLEDCWEVAETHCSSFFPEYSFPFDFMLRIDRLVGMFAGFSIPNGCKRTCLVAVIGSAVDDTFLLGSEEFKVGSFEGKFSLKRGYVTGILTVDTVADFLPRKGPLRQRSLDAFYVDNRNN